MYRQRHDIRRFLADNKTVVAVTIDAAKGSTPREGGAWMLVSPQSAFRTIGGGNLEFIAIDRARSLLADGRESEDLSIALGPEIGQCCGGHVTVKLLHLGREDRRRYVESIDRELAALPHVLIFGAGHVGHCLSQALSLLPVHPILIDTRADELATAPDGVETRLAALPEAVVRTAPQTSAFVILTHDHALDFLIALEALKRGDARYVGLIGSRTKRNVFRRWFGENGGTAAELERLTCPIGGQGSVDKRPEVIAGFVAAEIMAHLAEPAIIKPGKRESVKLGEMV